VAIDIAYAILTSAIFVPVILGLFIKWITERAAFLAIIISIVTVFIGLAIVGPNSNLIIILAIILHAITLLGASYYDNNLSKIAKTKNSLTIWLKCFEKFDTSTHILKIKRIFISVAHPTC